MFPDHDTRRLLQAGSAGALADAAAYLRRGVCPDGASDGETVEDFDLPERQWAAFLDWARDRDRIVPLTFPGPEREGGREHDVTLDESTGRWIKYTKPACSGYTVGWDETGAPYMRSALPLDYLQRLLWQNEILGDDVHLVGLRPAAPHRWSVVTTQPGLVGSRASLEELAAAFVAAGFTLLPWRGLGYENSLSLRFEGFDLWDVHPANVLLSPEGLPLPLDVLITRSPS